MKGEPKVIVALNEILAGELAAINQYFLHARIFKHHGFEKLAEKVYKESFDEMNHAQALIDRILYLEGTPSIQGPLPIVVGANVPAQLNADLTAEREAIARIGAGIELCQKASDHGSREMLEKMLRAEEEHFEWLEIQLGLINEFGKETYLAQQI